MLIGNIRKITGPMVSIPLILLMALCLTLPIYVNGIPKGNDLHQHFQFALTFYDSLRLGDVAPSYSYLSNSGFGDVGVRFYPPVSYLLLAGLKIATGGWHDAAVLAFAFWFFAGGVGVYLWSREHFEEAASVAAAFGYMIAPYHVNEVYNASLFAEFAAAGVLPFCFLFASRICRIPSACGILGLAVSYSLLVLTHLPTALIGSAGLSIFALASLRRPHVVASIAALASAAVLGLLMSSFYLMRMVPELDWVNHSASEFVDQAYDHRLNFIASYFFLPSELYGDGSQWLGDMLALTAACLFIPSLLYYLLRERSGTRESVIGAASVFFAGVFFATPLSAVVWDSTPLLQKIQFPYRWLVLVNVTGSFFIAAGFRQVVSAFLSNLRPYALICTGLMLAAFAFSAAQIIRPAIYVPKADAESYVAGLHEARSYNCWWPVWAKEAAFADKQRVSDPTVTQWDRYEKRFEVGPGALASLRLPLFYYPHWKAEANGLQLKTSPDENGALVIHLTDGPATVRVFFEEPVHVKIAALASAILWMALAGALLFYLVRYLKEYVYSYSDR